MSDLLQRLQAEREWHLVGGDHPDYEEQHATAALISEAIAFISDAIRDSDILKDRIENDGYTKALVAAAYENGKLNGREEMREYAGQLRMALLEMTPPMPPADAPCHKGICEQSACAYCSRIAQARKLIESVHLSINSTPMECEPMPAVSEDGWTEWIHPVEPYFMQCCDCGLIHEAEFGITKDKEGLPDGTWNATRVSNGSMEVIFRMRRARTPAASDEDRKRATYADMARVAGGDSPNPLVRSDGGAVVTPLEAPK